MMRVVKVATFLTAAISRGQGIAPNYGSSNKVGKEGSLKIPRNDSESSLWPKGTFGIEQTQQSLSIQPFVVQQTTLPEVIRSQAEGIMAQAPVPSTLFSKHGTNPLEAAVALSGKEIHDAAKEAYTRIAEVILALKTPEVQALGDQHPEVVVVKSLLNRAIDSIGPTHGGVVARLSETMIGVLERGIEDGSGSVNLSKEDLKVIQNYLKILMSEFPKKGKEIMSSFDPFYADVLETVSKDAAAKAVPLFREIKAMWADPRYFKGDMPHIVKLNNVLQEAAALLGVQEINPDRQSPEDISPHICLLNDALIKLKEGVGVEDVHPAHVRGIFGNPGLYDSSIGIVTGHIMPVTTELDRIKSMGGAETWEWTANFRTAFLAQLLVASGAATGMQDQPLYVPTHVIGEECHKDESHDANQHINFVDPRQEQAYHEGIATLKDVMMPFYGELNREMTGALGRLTPFLG